MISISKLETINTSQQWARSGSRVDIGGDVVLFEDESDAEDAVNAIGAVDDVIEIINAAKRWRKASKDLQIARSGTYIGGIKEATEELDASSLALIAMIDKVRE